ncbi:MAG: membrane integrity-associated transporter subunit PqiC [Verrucomicrobia bacterium]|nr:MAG: membrane integrity-associated transporter subunit PqiC [Verrucomicrobiota bacterium]TAE87694.1 MAG: membrane integrity-associated transporter subunit PqiC [Verrucomicrobiota bacterium]TAF25372.1 MAG: membrane integrity-associated transporter subunit PqiC [Verrucomicrobiota bacterium]TAF41159.1 MAG: membrane integrity-associated transporter subunit PqiC [Verrucomicrobiota bacterium]
MKRPPTSACGTSCLKRSLRRYLFLASSLLAVGCAAPKSYYFLSAEGPAPASGGIGIGVGPVVLASYLDRSNFVFQEGGNRMAIVESHRWAGELEENIARVTAVNLGRRLGTGNVRTYPWVGDGELRHQISVDIRQFHGTSDGEAVLEAAWRVYSLPDRRMSAASSWSGSEPLRADGYDELAAAQSRLLARLAGEMAATVK